MPDYYERLKSSYDTRFYQQEVLGEYLHLHAGRVYYAFEREKNVAEVKVDRKRALLWALDFNVDPMCSVVAQVEGEGVLVLDEIVLSRATTQRGVRGISEPVSGTWRGVDGVCGCVGSADADDGDDGRSSSEGVLSER